MPKTTSFKTISPSVWGLVAALPLMPAAHAETVAAHGAYSTGSILPYYPAKSGSFTQAATAAAFQASAVGVAAPTPPNSGLVSDSSARTTASYFGNGHFSGTASEVKAVNVFTPVHAETFLTYSTTIANLTSMSAPAVFTFQIGYVNFQYALGYGGGGANSASFAARIYAGTGTTPVWSSGYSITSQNSFYGVGTSSGTPLGFGPLPVNSYGFSTGISNYSQTLNLGMLSAGQSLDFRYEVDLITDSMSYGGYASVSFDDPIASLVLDTAAVGPVPEAPTEAMLAAGGALMAAVLRRRKRLATWKARQHRRQSRRSEHRAARSGRCALRSWSQPANASSVARAACAAESTARSTVCEAYFARSAAQAS